MEPTDAPANAYGIRRIMFAVDDIDEILPRLRKHGAELVGEITQYEDAYRLCYLWGPEGIMIAFVRRQAFPLAVAGIAVVFLLMFFVIPVLKILGASLYDSSGKTMTLANYGQVLTSRFFLAALTNSLGIAALASLFNRENGVHSRYLCKATDRDS